MRVTPGGRPPLELEDWVEPLDEAAPLDEAPLDEAPLDDEPLLEDDVLSSPLQPRRDAERVRVKRVAAR